MLLIIWIALMVDWQYFIIKYLFQEANFFPLQWSQLLKLGLVLFLLAIWISDCLCLAHIVKISMHLLSVSFQDGSSSSYFLMKLFQFWAYVNSLDHLNCSLAVLKIFFFISGRTFLSPSIKAVVGTCSRANSLYHLDFRLFMFGSHS